ncbi:MAG: SUMF1/EgtB/PvdO family nonheme iron enzyme [Pseudomonadales bacterium]
MEKQQQSHALNDGQIIGPEHHKFKLKGSATAHPLGQFWQAEDISTPSPTPVSIIVVSSELTRHKGLLAAFKQQIILAKNLHHKHIVTIYGYFVERGGILFFACEALDGLTLDTLIKTKKVTKLKTNHLRGLLLQTAVAVDIFTNKVRKPHGALAPDLIYINRQGGVKLLPISPRTLLQETSFTLQPAFQFPAYQSPEAFHANLLPTAADVYSVGCIAYAALSGTAPFSVTDDEALHVRKELKHPSKTSKDQWTVLQQALATDPEERQTSAIALIQALFKEEKETDSLSSTTAHQGGEEVIEYNPKIADTRLPPKLPIRLFLWTGLFIGGVIVGFTASLYYTQEQQTLTNSHIDAWKEQAQIWKAAADDHEQTIQRLENKLEEQAEVTTLSAATSPANKTAVLPREEAKLEENFGVFQDALENGSYGPQMISLPAGTFQLGDLNQQGDDNEKPVQTITLLHPFALSRFEVTFAQYDNFAKLTGRDLPNDEGWGRDSQPVINVSWKDATAYAAWLSVETGEKYRLPSEAEWEYAARSGSQSAFWWGNELSPQRAVCDECGSLWDGKHPAPIGSLPANPWGFHDLNGNVDEWVQDCYSETYQGHPSDGSARTQTNCNFRSMRGGSWFDISRVIRSASRYRHPPNTSRNTWGFRVALDFKSDK